MDKMIKWNYNFIYFHYLNTYELQSTIINMTLFCMILDLRFNTYFSQLKLEIYTKRKQQGEQFQSKGLAHKNTYDIQYHYLKLTIC
ncbi:hypothetical protein pb186bvf_020408 [Paramecium bursaria]